jgi:hypothetical protein
MIKYVFMVCFIWASFQLSARDSVNLYSCAPMSKDPKCWRQSDPVVDSMFGYSKLHCTSNGKVQYVTSHGEGSGCGESGKIIIKKQTRDWGKKEIYVETSWLAGVEPPSGPRCHYWGPVYGGGDIDTYLGTWKVILNGKLIGSYTYSVDTEQISDSETKYIQSCKLSLN